MGIEHILKQAAQKSQIPLYSTWFEPGIDKAFTEPNNTLPSQHWLHSFPDKQLPLPIGMDVIWHHEALEPANQKAAFGFDGAITVIACHMGIQISL